MFFSFLLRLRFQRFEAYWVNFDPVDIFAGLMNLCLVCPTLLFNKMILFFLTGANGLREPNCSFLTFHVNDRHVICFITVR